MSGKKGMIRYSEEIKEQVRKVKEKSAADMESAVIRYRAGAASGPRQS